MRILKTLTDLEAFLREDRPMHGCFADSGFLYALAYDDDHYFEQATAVFEVLSNTQTTVFTNVVSRMEFIDLIFRKQVTLGCMELFATLKTQSLDSPLFRLLRNIRDQNTANERKEQSFKIGEKHLKALRDRLVSYGSDSNWFQFCDTYVGKMLQSEWHILEDDFDLHFLEVMEGVIDSNFENPVTWADMVNLVGSKGLRSPDAMIANMFLKSHIPLLITSDNDFKFSLENMPEAEGKAVFIL